MDIQKIKDLFKINQPKKPGKGIKTTAHRYAEQKKRTQLIVIVSGIIIVAVGTLYSNMTGTDSKQDSGAIIDDEAGEVIDLVSDETVEKSYRERVRDQIKSLKEASNQNQDAIKELGSKLDGIKAANKERETQINKNFQAINETLQKIQGKIAKNADARGRRSTENSVPEPPAPPQHTETGNTVLPPPPKGKTPPPPDMDEIRKEFRLTEGKEGKGNASGSSESTGKELVASKDQANTVQEYRSFAPPKTAKSNDKVSVSVSRTKNPFAGYLTPGYMSTVLLTGVSAGTSTTSQSNPAPVLMRIQGPAQLPGSAQYQLTGCFLTGTAFGDIRTQRVEIDLASISCIDKENQLVLEEPLTGFIVDSDGEKGLRGQLVEQRGAVLFKATLASIVDGLGSVLSDAQGTTFSTPTGEGTSISGSDLVTSAGLSGFSKAANMLSEFYLKEAERLFPVIRVRPTRKATAVITKGKSLQWSNYGTLFVKKVTPE